MSATMALLAALLAAAPTADRVLLCRSRVVGEVSGDRSGAVFEAARAVPGRFLDYGAACDDVPEAVRAARRAGLRRALTSTVERAGELTRYVLSLADASLEREVARREVAVSRGEDALPALQRALRELASAPATEPTSSRRRSARLRGGAAATPRRDAAGPGLASRADF